MLQYGVVLDDNSRIRRYSMIFLYPHSTIFDTLPPPNRVNDVCTCYAYTRIIVLQHHICELVGVNRRIVYIYVMIVVCVT